jgi:hypothetical protein
VIFVFFCIGTRSFAYDECPAGSFASIYENKIYQIRHVSCLKKIKKKFVKHGPVSQFSFEGKLLKQDYFMNGKPAKKEDFNKQKSNVEIVKEINTTSIPIRANKTSRIHLRHKTRYEIKNSNPQVAYFNYDLKLNQLLVTGSKLGQARLEILDDGGGVLEKIDINVYPNDTDKNYVISGDNENIYYFSKIKENGLLLAANKFAAILVDNKIEKVEAWDNNLIAVFSISPVIRIKALKKGKTHLRLFFKGQSEFARLDVSIK